MNAVILTSSYMKNGRCITAWDLDKNRVVRFVGSNREPPVRSPYYERFHTLQVYDVSVIDNCPLSCQTENVLISFSNTRCLGIYENGIADLHKRFRAVDYGDSSFLPDGDDVLTNDVSLYRHSLEIVKASALGIVDKKAYFTCQGREYKGVSITDPKYRGTEQFIGEAYLVISIPTSPWDNGLYYKFVAAIYPIAYSERLAECKRKIDAGIGVYSDNHFARFVRYRQEGEKEYAYFELDTGHLQSFLIPDAFELGRIHFADS